MCTPLLLHFLHYPEHVLAPHPPIPPTHLPQVAAGICNGYNCLNLGVGPCLNPQPGPPPVQQQPQQQDASGGW